MSAPTDRLLVWRAMRCDARDPTHAQHAGVENVSRSFHAHREPQQSTRFGQPRDNSFSRSKDATVLMRRPSARGGACAPPATPLRLAPLRPSPGRDRVPAIRRYRSPRRVAIGDKIHHWVVTHPRGARGRAPSPTCTTSTKPRLYGAACRTGGPF
jgi:hypothetical protein